MFPGHTTIHKQRFSSSFATLLLTFMMLLTTAVPSGATQAQVPLYLTSAVNPNILFIIDDSGSMAREVMPDSIASIAYNGANHYIYAVFPPRYRPSGYSSISSIVATFSDDNIRSFYLRCAHNNKIFYNPLLTYTPWSKADGTLWDAADPNNAYYFPTVANDNDHWSIDLTEEQTDNAYWVDQSVATGTVSVASTTSTTSKDYWPLTFYVYKGSGASGDEYLAASYIRYQIRGTEGFKRDLDGGTEESVSSFTWNDGTETITRTVAEETQNFANWFTYYRNRMLTAQSGVGKAFADQDSNMRVGFGAINQGTTNIDGVNTAKLITGVRPFIGTDRSSFFDELYDVVPNGSTPLRSALDYAGRYYQRTDNAGPWGDTPGDTSDNSDVSEQIQCRQSYTIMMTDGYWNSDQAGTSAARQNVDGAVNGPVITSADGDTTYQYTPVSPFKDNRSNMLADVAMYYWNHDLHGDLPNNVPISAIDPAFWQHMTTFTVGLGVDPDEIDPDEAFAAITTGASISWSSDLIDDLLHAAVNGHGGFFSAADPETFAEELSSTLDNIVARTESSATAVSANSTKLTTDTVIYQAKFDSTDWSGQLLAYNIDTDSNGNISLGSTVWDTDSGCIPAHGNRNIFTYNDNSNAGVIFKWANLSASQQTALGDVKYLNWLRGDQSQETTEASGTLRARTKILGDIVHSSPVLIGTPNFHYDELATGTAGQSSYTDYRVATTRPKVLYVGANDGMLHAFQAETGEELFAYVPGGVYDNLASLADPDYDHHYFVDGVVGYGDVYIDGSWKTILVGSLGAGGRTIFALDVSDPENFSASDVLWEYSDADLGSINGPAQVVHLANGDWGVVFNNGVESDNDRAMLFVINAKTGALIAKIDTEVGSSTQPNGLATVAVIDDSEQTAETVYAGDLLGNMWNFDLSSSNENSWDSAYKSSGNPAPLFTARNDDGDIQPITASVEVSSYDGGGYMVYFGTGKYIEEDDKTDLTLQSLYGILDDGTPITTTDRSELLEQTIIAQGDLTGDSNDWRVTSANTIDYDTQRGWYLDLIPPDGTAEGERVIATPTLRYDRVIFVTIIPSEDPCDAGGDSWIMELTMDAGSRPSESVYDTNSDNAIDDTDTATVDGEQVVISGRKVNVGMVSTPSIVEAEDDESKIFSGSDGNIEIIKESGGSGLQYGRRSWLELQ